MKVKQGMAVNAYGAIAGLSGKSMSFPAAMKLYKLRKALQEVVEFQEEQERKIVKEMGGIVTPAGQVLFEGEKNAKMAEFRAKHKELEEMEYEISLDGKVTLDMGDIPECTISDIANLEGFIEWKEG